MLRHRLPHGDQGEQVVVAINLPTGFLDAFTSSYYKSKLSFSPTSLNVPSRADTFSLGQQVRVQDPFTKRWDSVGVIHKICDSGRSFFVKCADGRLLSRNQRFLKQVLILYSICSHSSKGEENIGKDNEFAPTV